MVFSVKLYDASFGNAKGGSHQPPPPTPAKVAKHGLRARVKYTVYRVHVLPVGSVGGRYLRCCATLSVRTVRVV